MKKWILLLVGVGVIVTAWWAMRTFYRYTPPWRMPEFGQVTRGDIRVPITAAGLIEPARRIDMKSEASGEVIELPVAEGDAVKKGDTLVVLKRDDEERNVARADAGLTRAKALLEQAKVAVEKAKATIISAESRVDELGASGESYKSDLDHLESLPESAAPTQQQLITARSRVNVNNAQLENAKAQVEIAKLDLDNAGQQVIVQEAAVAEQQQVLDDAKERLDETTIRAPTDAIVTRVGVRVGNLVQSGIQTIGMVDSVMVLADISSLKVIARVDEADYGKVHDISPLDALPEIEGLRQSAMEEAAELERRSGKVKLYVDAFPEDTFEGMIERVEPQGKLNAGQAIIQFDVHVVITDEHRYKLPLGAQAQVEFTVESATDTLIVPAEAVKTHRDQRGVWVRTAPTQAGEEGEPKFIPCRFGITDGTSTQVTEVLGGNELKEGMTVYKKLPPKPRDEQ